MVARCVTEAQTVIGGRLVVVVDALMRWPMIAPGPMCGGAGGAAVDRVVVFDDEPRSGGGLKVSAATVSTSANCHRRRRWRLRGRGRQTGRRCRHRCWQSLNRPRSPLWVRLAGGFVGRLGRGDFVDAAAPDQASAIEGVAASGARRLPSDAADLAGVFLDRVADRIGEGQPSCCWEPWLRRGQDWLPSIWRSCCRMTRIPASRSLFCSVCGRPTAQHRRRGSADLRPHDRAAARRKQGRDRRTPASSMSPPVTPGMTPAPDVIWHTVSPARETGETSFRESVGVPLFSPSTRWGSRPACAPWTHIRPNRTHRSPGPFNAE